MPTNQYNRERYRLRKEAGLCTRCPNKVNDGHPFCLACRGKHNVRTKKRRDSLDQIKRCRCCAKGKEQENKTYCNECLAKRRAAKEEKVRSRLEAGLCQDCGYRHRKGVARPAC